MKKGNSDWIRMDFMLEYYLSKSMAMTKSFSNKMSSDVGVRSYATEFLRRYGPVMANESRFQFADYNYWLNSKKSAEEERALFPKRKL